MPSFSISRFFSSPFPFKLHPFSLSSITLSTISLSAAEKYYTHLLKHNQNPEKTLGTIRAQLDPSCINEVMYKCSLNEPKLGLRFFIWAGFHRNYRHSQFMYSNACKLFEIRRNPNRISELVEGYRDDGCVINVKMFKVLLNLCREAGLADEALWVLRKMGDFKCRPDTTAYNVVIRLLCEKDDVETAICLVREMEVVDLHPDMMTYMAMIKGLCSSGRLEDACELFKVMKSHGCVPNSVAYSALLDGLCQFGGLEKALELLEDMEKEGGDCSPNVITYTTVIQRFCEKGQCVEALSILDRMECHKCSPNRVTVSTLIEGLCAQDCIDEAFKLIDRVVAGGSVSKVECYNSLVITLLRSKRLEEAEKLFKWMLKNSVRPDGLVCSIIIKDLCVEGRVLDGFNLYEEVEKMGFLSSIDSEIYSILLVGLGRGSFLVEACRVANLMIEKGIQIKGAYVLEITEHLKGSKASKLVPNLCSVK